MPARATHGRAGWGKPSGRASCIVLHREAKEQLATSVSRRFSARPHVLTTFTRCGEKSAGKTRSAGNASRNLPRGIISAAGIPVLAPAIRRSQAPYGLDSLRFLQVPHILSLRPDRGPPRPISRLKAPLKPATIDSWLSLKLHAHHEHLADSWKPTLLSAPFWALLPCQFLHWQ